MCVVVVHKICGWSGAGNGAHVVEVRRGRGCGVRLHSARRAEEHTKFFLIKYCVASAVGHVHRSRHSSSTRTVPEVPAANPVHGGQVVCSEMQFN